MKSDSKDNKNDNSKKEETTKNTSNTKNKNNCAPGCECKRRRTTETGQNLRKRNTEERRLTYKKTTTTYYCTLKQRKACTEKTPPTDPPVPCPKAEATRAPSSSTSEECKDFSGFAAVCEWATDDIKKFCVGFVAINCQKSCGICDRTPPPSPAPTKECIDTGPANVCAWASSDVPENCIDEVKDDLCRKSCRTCGVLSPTHDPTSSPTHVPTRNPRRNPTLEPTLRPSVPLRKEEESCDDDDTCFALAVGDDIVRLCDYVKKDKDERCFYLTKNWVTPDSAPKYDATFLFSVCKKTCGFCP